MDLELMGSSFMILLMPIVGIAGIIICISILKKTAKAEMVPATIVSFTHSVHREKYLTYAVQIENNKIIELRRLVELKSSSNRLAAQYLGREVTVPYDREHNKLFPHEPIVRGYLIFSAMLALMGCGVIVFLGLGLL